MYVCTYIDLYIYPGEPSVHLKSGQKMACVRFIFPVYISDADRPNVYISNADRPNVYISNADRPNVYISNADMLNVYISNADILHVYISNADMYTCVHLKRGHVHMCTSQMRTCTLVT